VKNKLRTRLPRWPFTNRRSGLTIIEVAIAATVMALVLATSITAMQYAFRSLDTARNITIAGQIMQSEFEKLRLKPWTGTDGISSLATNPSLTIDTVFTSKPFISNRFSLARTVTAITTGTSAGMKAITLTCSWKTYSGRQISRSYVCYYGQNGLYDYFFNSI
jgi:Tfp pilus assembly protein PilV